MVGGTVHSDLFLKNGHWFVFFPLFVLIPRMFATLQSPNF